MAKPQDPSVAALREGLRKAWNHLRKQHPTEQVYAFGVYTTEGAEYMLPFACGEEGLRRVAERYVKEKIIYKTVEDAAQGLRWSIADSPYEKMFSEKPFGVDEVFGDDNPLDLPDTKMAREIHRRLNAATDALTSLDAEGLFGKGKARERIVLLIEAGDRPDEFVEKWAKKLNPAKVFNAWKVPEPEELGTYVEFGTNKVYTTDQYSLSKDHSVIAAAADYMFFVFSLKGRSLKQLAGRGFKGELQYRRVSNVGLAPDASRVAVHVDGMNGKAGHLVWVDGPDWKSQREVKLPARGMSMVIEPRGKWVAIGDEKAGLQIHPADGGKPSVLKKAHKDWVRSLAVTADGSRLASAGGKELIVWDTKSWKPLKKIKDDGDTLDISADGKFVVATKKYGALDRPKQGDRAAVARVFDAKTGKAVRDVEVTGFSVAVARFSPDGKQVALALKGLPKGDEYVVDEEAALVEVASRKVLSRLRSDFESINDFAFLPGRGEIAVAVHGHTRRPLLLWKLGK